MGKLTWEEKDILKVVENELSNATREGSLKETKHTLDFTIDSSEMLLRSLGIEIDSANINIIQDVDFSDIFTPEKIQTNSDIVNKLNEEFNGLHRLDKVDWAICSVAGLIAAAIGIILVSIPLDKIKELEKKLKFLLMPQ